MAEPKRQIHTETDIKAYEGYIPEDWGEKTIGPIAEGTVLERLLLDLALLWRTASYTAQMPATTIKAMHAAAVGRGKVVTPDASIVSFSDGIIGRLAQRVPHLLQNRRLGNTLVKELATIATEFRDKAAAVKRDFPIEPIWAEFMTQVGFRLSLWSSQRIAYIAFYNAYEGFLVDCVKVATGATSIRTQREEFKNGLRRAFAKDIGDPCWLHQEINVARLVRHALSHNGGRLTEDLRKQKHGIKLVGDELQVIPADNHRMLHRLRMAVDDVIAATKKDPKFMAPAAKLPQPREDEE